VPRADHRVFSTRAQGSQHAMSTQNLLQKNTLDLMVVGVAWMLVSYAIAFGQSDSMGSFMGLTHFGLSGADTLDMSFVFLQWTFATNTATIFGGAVVRGRRG